MGSGTRALGIVLALQVAAASSQSTVNVWLQSSWGAPPLALEVLESSYTEDPSSYFPVLFELSHHVSRLEAALTPQDEYGGLIDILNTSNITLSSPRWEIPSVEAAVAMHVTTPKIQAFYQYYGSAVNETEAGSGVGMICDSWVEWRGKGFCDVESLKADLELTLEAGHEYRTNPYPHPKILAFDHIYPSSLTSSSPSPAILYISSFNTAQANLLFYLTSHYRADPTFRFIVRYRPQLTPGFDSQRRRNSLKGYGVEMVLKRTDYLVVDDRQTGQASGQVVIPPVKKGDSGGLDPISAVLGEDPWAELEVPLKAAEIEDLAIKAASLVLSMKDPLDTLVKVSQDFPKLSGAIARHVEINTDVAREVAENQRIGRLGHAVWINGRPLKPSEGDIYLIMDMIREERATMNSLISLGLTPQKAWEFLMDETVADAITEEDPMSALVDASDRPEHGGVILWWNDLEKDKKYAAWQASLGPLLRGPPQGQMAPIRRNLWNVVLVIDLSSRQNIAQITQVIKMFISRKVPIRFGFVPLITGQQGEASWQIFELVYQGVQQYGRGFAMDFLNALMESTQANRVDLTLAERIFTALDNQQRELLDEAPTTTAIDPELKGKILAYLKRVGATPADSPSGHYFFNGMAHPFSQSWTHSVSQDYMQLLQYLRMHEAAQGGIDLNTIDTFFYDLPTTSKRRNKHIVPASSGSPLSIVDYSAIFHPVSLIKEQFIYPDPESDTPVTLRIVGNLDGRSAQQLARNAVEFMNTQEDALVRLGLVHTPATASANDDMVLSTILYQWLASGGTEDLSLSQIDSLLDRALSGDLTGLATLATLTGDWAGEGISELDRTAAGIYWTERAALMSASLAGDAESCYVMVNGRLIGPVSAEEFSADDFHALVRFEARARVGPVVAAINSVLPDVASLNRDSRSDLYSSVSAIIAKAYQPSQQEGLLADPVAGRFDAATKLRGHSAVIDHGEASSSLIRIYAIFDPLAELTQKWAGLLQLVTKLPHVSLQIRLNPTLSLTEIPVKRFYRFEGRTQLTFDVDGYESKTAASFQDLPGEPIFTLGMDVPASWIVAPKSSVHDLDNLRLDAISSRQGSSIVDVTFELEQFAIAGHAREADNSPPRGLQLQLHDLEGRSLADTQVMANLGYLQLKANPGVMQLSIRPGRGKDIYFLGSMTDDSGYKGTNSAPGEVALTSFRGLTLFPKFERHAGMEAADVLDVSVAAKSEGILGKMFSAMSSVIYKPVKPVQQQAEINIFTVASGMLYERFASIMILSVLKHTKSTVKFWFIENFLSPTFLEFLPHFAEEYGFQYEVITYRWPSWLRAQKEKQREIWAYKILFLDVLFPMELDKVMFVDADQIVRTDLKELVDLDLQGRVYGYTPMGDDKPEMEGFRFWKTGYWKDSLRGRPYHISALYVIDLKRFRQVAAGDRLRGQYQALSADPNSLANLDQDLPNSMQDQIPIFSLDKSWLWCETWCSQDSLKDAKTIDLCQNPLTKEPKLDRARKIPEWDEYDREVAAFTKRLQEQQATALGGQIGSADEVEALADIGSVEVVDEDATEKESHEEARVIDEL